MEIFGRAVWLRARSGHSLGTVGARSPNYGTGKRLGSLEYFYIFQKNQKHKNIFHGRGERIRTSDSCVPNAVLYQAELHPAEFGIIPPYLKFVGFFGHSI